MAEDERPPYMIAHSDHGAPECCGRVRALSRTDDVNFQCDECGAVVRTVPIGEVPATIEQMRSDKTDSSR
jgi:hypothetical protein